MGLDLHLENLNTIEKCFVLMPYQHTENIEDSRYGLKLLENIIKKENDQSNKNILKKFLYHHKEHLKVLMEFGRFPKRNIYLGRESTEEEIDYIDETGDRNY